MHHSNPNLPANQVWCVPDWLIRHCHSISMFLSLGMAMQHVRLSIALSLGVDLPALNLLRGVMF